jgi:hypothetical protein
MERAWQRLGPERALFLVLISEIAWSGLDLEGLGGLDFVGQFDVCESSVF